MSKSKPSWKMLILLFIVEFIAVFAVLTLLSFLELASCGPFVAGFVAGIVLVVLSLLFRRRGEHPLVI